MQKESSDGLGMMGSKQRHMHIHICICREGLKGRAPEEDLVPARKEHALVAWWSSVRGVDLDH